LISKSKENKVYNIGFEIQSTTLFLHYDYSARIYSANNYSEEFNENNEFEYENNSIVDVEVDCEKKTIYFFINKKQCPYYVSDISSSSFPLLFGFRSCNSPIVEIISLFKILPSSLYTNSSFKCKPVKWVLFIYFFNYLILKII
jgi:hypothetical protein